MKGDMVVIDSSKLDEFRFKHVLGKLEFYKRVGVHPGTGQKMFEGKPIHLQIARRIASVIGVDVAELIQSWSNQPGESVPPQSVAV